MKKRSLAKNTCFDWYDWLINYIPQPIKIVGGVKDNSMIFLKKYTIKHYSKPKCFSNVYGGGKKPRKPKIIRQSKDNTIKNIRKSFRLKKKMKQSKTE